MGDLQTADERGPLDSQRRHDRSCRDGSHARTGLGGGSQHVGRLEMCGVRLVQRLATGGRPGDGQARARWRCLGACFRIRGRCARRTAGDGEVADRIGMGGRRPGRVRSVGPMPVRPARVTRLERPGTDGRPDPQTPRLAEVAPGDGAEAGRVGFDGRRGDRDRWRDGGSRRKGRGGNGPWRGGGRACHGRPTNRPGRGGVRGWRSARHRRRRTRPGDRACDDGPVDWSYRHRRRRRPWRRTWRRTGRRGRLRAREPRRAWLRGGLGRSGSPPTNRGPCGTPGLVLDRRVRGVADEESRHDARGRIGRPVVPEGLEGQRRRLVAR